MKLKAQHLILAAALLGGATLSGPRLRPGHHQRPRDGSGDDVSTPSPTSASRTAGSPSSPRTTITGKETIDATGHVVAPGFIDTHWHYDRPWSNKLALRDGRTTVLDLEIGTHGPYIDQWYKAREGKNQVNYGQAVGP